MKHAPRAGSFALTAALAILGAYAGPLNAQDQPRDPREMIRQLCAEMGAGCATAKNQPSILDCPTLQELRGRGVDIVPLLIEVAREQEHDYVLQVDPLPGMQVPFDKNLLHGDQADRHLHVVRNTVGILRETRDPRAGRFLVELALNRGEPFDVRRLGLARLDAFPDLPEAHDLLVRTLREPEALFDKPRWAVEGALFMCSRMSRFGLQRDWSEMVRALEYRLGEEEKYHSALNAASKKANQWRIDDFADTIRALRELSTVPERAEAPVTSNPTSESSKPAPSPATSASMDATAPRSAESVALPVTAPSMRFVVGAAVLLLLSVLVFRRRQSR